jgi:hypothetical protein
MSTTTTILGVNELRGPSGPKGEQRIFEIPVRVAGTYATAAKPNFDVFTAIANAHFGAVPGSFTVKNVLILRDRYDGTNRYTAPDANVALSSGLAGNSLATFRIDSGAVNGTAGTEVTDGTDVTGIYVFIARCTAFSAE